MKRSFPHSSRSSVFPTLLVILAALPANAQTYRIRELPPPNATGGSGVAGINEAGVAVGSGLTLSGARLALQWVNGTPIELGVLPGFERSFAHDISNDNRIVGISGNSCEPTAPTRWDAGQMEALPDLQHVTTELYSINHAGTIAVGEGYDSCTRPWNDAAYQWQYVAQDDNWVVSILPPLAGDPEAGAYDVNDAGVVAGFSGDSSGPSHLRACRWDTDVPSLIPDLGGDYSIAFGLNDVGQFAGYSRTVDGTYRGFFSDGTTAIDLGTLPGYAHSSAHKLNTAGTVTGHAFNGSAETMLYPNFFPEPNQRAFVWRDGVTHYAYDLIPAGSGWTSLNSLFDINERGQITGYGVRAGRNRAFLLTPECLFDGDLNDDRAIDLADLAALLSNFGCTNFVCPGDLNGDGDTDLADLATLLANFGSTCP